MWRGRPHKITLHQCNDITTLAAAICNFGQCALQIYAYDCVWTVAGTAGKHCFEIEFIMKFKNDRYQCVALIFVDCIRPGWRMSFCFLQKYFRKTQLHRNPMVRNNHTNFEKHSNWIFFPIQVKFVVYSIVCGDKWHHVFCSTSALIYEYSSWRIANAACYISSVTHSTPTYTVVQSSMSNCRSHSGDKYFTSMQTA